MEDFNYAVCGHYHTPTTMYINDTRVWVNGSTESYNTYALEQLASMGRPSQFCLFVKPDKGVTAEYLVNLEE
jgi:DNA repair exonuclease SbcCD nuclease subunit